VAFLGETPKTTLQEAQSFAHRKILLPKTAPFNQLSPNNQKSTMDCISKRYMVAQILSLPHNVGDSQERYSMQKVIFLVDMNALFYKL
jgi:hypothetical protein